MKKNLLTRLLPDLAVLGLVAIAPLAQAAPYTTVQPSGSAVTFRYQQMGVAMDGRFRKFTPQISFDPAKPEQAKASVEVELASIDAGSPDADQEVVGKSWFNTAAFPKAVFTSKQIRQTAPNQYEVTGTLAIKGNTRELKFPLKLTPNGKQASFTGGFTLKRADFAIGEGMWSKFDIVANDVQVNFQLNAVQGK